MDDYWEGFMDAMILGDDCSSSKHTENYDSVVSDYEEEQLYKEIYGDDDDDYYDEDDEDEEDDQYNEERYYYAPADNTEKSTFEQATASVEKIINDLRYEKVKAERLEAEKKQALDRDIKAISDEKRRYNSQYDNHNIQVKLHIVAIAIIVLGIISVLCKTGSSIGILLLLLFAVAASVLSLIGHINARKKALNDISISEQKIESLKAEYYSYKEETK